MEIQEPINETDIEIQVSVPKNSKMAITSLVFALLGPFSAGTAWIASLSNFLRVPSPLIMVPFSCILTWLAGLIVGIISLSRIKKSQAELLGKEYAIVAIIVSGFWMFLLFIAFVLPGIYYVNS